MSIYKTCDIRGRYGSELNIRHARRLGQAICALKSPQQVVVGGDGRESTPILKKALIESLLLGGCNVIDLGIIPTPIFYFARQRLGVETGVQVTASHNPAADNGFKLTLGELPISPEEVQELADWMEGDHPDFRSDHPGECMDLDLLPAYITSLEPFLPDLTGLKVVLDCANGMAGLAARQLWSKTGAKVTYLLEEVDGRFPVHSPNPAQENNLTLVKKAVVENQADLGIAYDGDADRAAFVDEKGTSVVTDKVIVLFANAFLKQGPDIVVYDQKCSLVVAEAVRAQGGTPVMQLSGHTFIKRAFMQHQAIYAGEFSGHHFFRHIGRDDGLFASLIMANLIKQGQQPLSEMVKAIPSYPITPEIRLPMTPAEIERLMLDLEANAPGQASIMKTDGIRLEFERGWALIRPSVTEPVVTLRFEARDPSSLTELVSWVKNSSALLKDASF